MVQKFKKENGAYSGASIKAAMDRLPDGHYALAIERVDGDKRSLPANRLYFGAVCQELARWEREENGGSMVTEELWHWLFKTTCLPVIAEARRKSCKKKRIRLPDGSVRYRWTGGKNPDAASTTDLDPDEFSRYLNLCADVAKHVYKYPHHFDFTDQQP